MSLLESVSMCIAPLEIHFPKIGAESILENITLAGGLLPEHRIVSFVRNTITFVLSETRGQNDQTYLLTNALVSLFFSDAPNHAIDFFGGRSRLVPQIIIPLSMTASYLGLESICSRTQ
jgi:hypothetical protein